MVHTKPEKHKISTQQNIIFIDFKMGLNTSRLRISVNWRFWYFLLSTWRFWPVPGTVGKIRQDIFKKCLQSKRKLSYRSNIHSMQFRESHLSSCGLQSCILRRAYHSIKLWILFVTFFTERSDWKKCGTSWRRNRSMRRRSDAGNNCLWM